MTSSICKLLGVLLNVYWALLGELKALGVEWVQLDEPILSLGLVNGRNLWRTDLAKALAVLHPAKKALGERLSISASCSLLHVPTDLNLEQKLDAEIRGWMAFATQKLDEIGTLKRAMAEGEAAVWRALQQASAAAESRRLAPATRCERVRANVAALTERSAQRGAPFSERILQQHAVLKVPPLPTTTIGSFPQTADIRAARAAFKNGQSSMEEYDSAMKSAIRDAVARQEALGPDVWWLLPGNCGPA